MKFIHKHLSKLEFFAIIASITSCILSILCFVAQIVSSSATGILAVSFVIQNAAIIGALILLAGYFIRQAEIKDKKLEEWAVNRFKVPRSIHVFVHEIRKVFCDENEQKVSIETVSSNLEKACNSCKEIFDLLTKVENVVTIKMLVDESTFVSVARDQKGISSRELLSDYQTIDENTAFSTITMKHTNLKSRVYLNNKLHHTKTYSNDKPDWQERYTSVIIVPIRKNDLLLGSISVDCNLESNKRTSEESDAVDVYNDENHLQILSIFSDLLFCVLFKALMTHDAEQKEAEPVEKKQTQRYPRRKNNRVEF